MDADPGSIPPTLPLKRRIKSVTPLQYGKMSAAIFGALGLVLFPFILIATVIPAIMSRGDTSVPVLVLTAVFVAVLCPVVYGLMGFLMGVIGAWLYNLMARWLGGIEIELE